MSVRLRNVELSDLPIFFEDQQNKLANEMAAMKPQGSEAFYQRWDRILKDSSVNAKTILFDETVAGSISCFMAENDFCIGYWVSYGFWGRGIASEAVRLMLEQVDRRPIIAHAADTNAASIRVLTKNGFVITGTRYSGETDRYCECTEVMFRLDAAAQSLGQAN